jgi:uncharacterized protein YjbJ (UPF0337 family)
LLAEPARSVTRPEQPRGLPVQSVPLLFAAGRYFMGELTDKIEGVSNEIAGKIKQATGDAADRPDIQAEGEAQEAKGEGQNLKGSVKGLFGDKV